MLILPAIDLIDGQCVRLYQGDYNQKKIYNADPVEVARDFEAQGATWLHVVDLDAAKSGVPENTSAITEILAKTSLQLEVGGGVRSLESAKALLDLGVKRVIIGTKLAQDPEMARALFQTFGDRVVAGIDTRDGMVATHGWQSDSGLDGLTFAKTLAGLGCQRVIVTDIATDGALQGPNLPMMAQWCRSLSIPVIASGGVSSLADLVALQANGTEGVIVGKALYENRFTVAEAIGLKYSNAVTPGSEPRR